MSEKIDIDAVCTDAIRKSSKRVAAGIPIETLKKLKELADNQVDLDPEFQQALNEDLWDLI